MIHIEGGASGAREAMALYRNVLAEGVLAASSETDDGFMENALGPQTNDFWTAETLPAWLGVTLPSAVTCDSAGIAAHTLGSAGATVAVQAYIGAAWVTVATVTPEDDDDILILFAEAEAEQWRIYITGAGDAPHLGIASIGPKLPFPLGVAADYRPIYMAHEIELMSSQTRGGQFLGNRINRIGAATTISLAQQEREWIETDGRPFMAHFNEGRPFFFASCPDLLPEDAAYCWRSGGNPFGAYGPGARYGTVTLDVEAYIG